MAQTKSAAGLDVCPTCGCWSLMQSLTDEEPHCMICGYIQGIFPPHGAYSYRRDDFAEIEDEPNFADLDAVKEWLVKHEAEGFVFTTCVVVDAKKTVQWLRGDPQKRVVGKARQ